MIYIICGIAGKIDSELVMKLVRLFDCGTVIEGKHLVRLPTNDEREQAEKMPRKNFLILTNRPKSEITIRSVTVVYTVDEAAKLVEGVK